MTGGVERPWAILAFDHRERAFSSVRPAGMQHQQIREAKELIFDAFTAAVERGLGDARPGVLVDEEFGAPIARRASALGFAVSMPVERASEAVLAFEYGESFREHVLEFRPACAKALVHYKTTDTAETKQTQLSRLRELSEFLVAESIDFMLELIVGTTTDASGGAPTVDVDMLCDSMADMQEAGVQVDLWKVEGIASHAAAGRVAEQARASDDRSRCLILGAGAPTEVVEGWLDVAASTSGFSGFAIGRSIWGGPVAAWLDGRLARDEAVDQIASTYRSCTLRYVGAGVG